MIGLTRGEWLELNSRVSVMVKTSKIVTIGGATQDIYLQYQGTDYMKIVESGGERSYMLFESGAKVEVEKTTDHHNKGKIFRAEINIHLKEKFLRAEATREDIYLAINEARDELKREFKKYKEIIIDKHRKTDKRKRRQII